MRAMSLTLQRNPPAFLAMLHSGFVVDTKVLQVFLDSVDYVESSQDETSVCKLKSVYVQLQSLSLLMQTSMLPTWRVAEKCAPAQTFAVQTLMQMCRSQIHRFLASRTVAGIPELDLPLPRSLIAYLCFSDVQ